MRVTSSWRGIAESNWSLENVDDDCDDFPRLFNGAFHTGIDILVLDIPLSSLLKSMWCFTYKVVLSPSILRLGSFS